MFKRWLIALTLILSSCRSVENAGVEAGSNDSAPQHLAEKSTPHAQQTVHTTINSVRIGVSLPADWQVDEYNGLVMAENIGDPDGMVIYLFVPTMTEFPASEGNADDNYALSVLRRIVKMPSHIGHDVALSEPLHMTWDDCDAAYYLLTSGDGVKSLVLAIEVPGENRLVVLNISMPAAGAELIRSRLPDLLNALTINDTQLSGAALNHLPDPLLFPEYRPQQPEPLSTQSAEN